MTRRLLPHACCVFDDPYREETEDDGDYDEDRMRVLGRVGAVVLVVVYTERNGVVADPFQFLPEKPSRERKGPTMRDFDNRDTTKQEEAIQRPGNTDWTRVEAVTDEQALQNALADPDNPPLTAEQLARMRPVPNPQEVRHHLGLTQREFAQQFQIALGILRDWEQGARRPDSAAKAYPRVIAVAPDAVRRILHVRTEENQCLRVSRAYSG